MRWIGRRQSTNVEDYRGRRFSRGGIAGIGGLGGLIIIAIALFMGVDPSQLLVSQVDDGGVGQVDEAPGPPPQDERGQFVSVVLADTEDVWRQLFAGAGTRYAEPTLVLFSEAVPSACGYAGSAVGPFYCPADQKVYIDLTFFDDLQHRFGASGDFARAYVIAHEIGHHVQNLLGISEQVQSRRGQVSEEESNALSVRTELQADCLAGVWAHHDQRMNNALEPGDIEEALGAATAIGDDRIQRQTQGYVVPDAFTHGSSEQRARWFHRGFETGDFNACNTFESRSL
ncbi:MAG: neutral zinc metallopeptidase [Acidobacteria bacterium]|nr:neutral zinc metallopeptidase [Acidobacteriota bacterium]